MAPQRRRRGPGMTGGRCQFQRRHPPARGPAAAGVPSSSPLLSVDCGHLVQAVLFGFEPQVGDAVGHVHSLGRVGVRAGGRVGCHGTDGGERERERDERVTSAVSDSELTLTVIMQLWKHEYGRRH